MNTNTIVKIEKSGNRFNAFDRDGNKLTSEIIPKLRIFRKVSIDIPTLYIMGEQDYMFLSSVKKVTESHPLSKLLVLEGCGHVVNVEKPEKFNNGMLSFIKK